MTSHLFIVDLGGKRTDSLFEIHEAHVVVARDEGDLFAQCREKIADRLDAAHIDAWFDFPVDRAELELASAPDLRFYLVESGLNSPKFLREQHQYAFVAAPDGRAAIAEARKTAGGWHVDAVVDIDGLAEACGWRLRRGAEDRRPEYRHVARYQRL